MSTFFASLVPWIGGVAVLAVVGWVLWRNDRDRPQTTFLASSATCSRRWANHPAPVVLLLEAMLLNSKVALAPNDSRARL